MFDEKEGNSFRNPPGNPIDAKVDGCPRLNFRSSPEVSDRNILGTIPEGTTVTILNKDYGEWSLIGYEGKNGYVMNKFLKDVDR